jgi:regulator of ribosome biosynthesis
LKYDIGNLCAYDHESLDIQQYQRNKPQYLEELARDNVQLLLNHIFDCETEAADMGRLAHLPKPTTVLPRHKPLPAVKAQTKWEAFASTKGINKRKRGRMLWDEAEQKYAPRYGYGRANDESKLWAIPHTHGMDETDDPFTVMSKAKKQRVADNEKKRQNNLSAASGDRVPGMYLFVCVCVCVCVWSLLD